MYAALTFRKVLRVGPSSFPDMCGEATMMTTPRLVSLTALAASLFIVILTITQANGLTATPEMDVASVACIETTISSDCPASGSLVQAAVQR
jgi:hypothetical protein|tara:strand:+ start:199 stop:474 length:276 start_codon:yes stop_codon:yes gene_type:complete